MSQGIWSRKSPIYLALVLATASSYNAVAFEQRGTDVIKRISLVKKKPVENQALTTPSPLASQSSATVFDSDITRELNRYPGVFAVNTIVNGQAPLVSYNSDPSNQSAALTLDNRNVGPLPYLDRTLAQYTPLNRRLIAPLSTPNYAISPTDLVGGISSSTATTQNKRNVAVAVGSDQQADINLDYAQQKGDWGHLFQVAHQQRDSYREGAVEMENGVTTNDVLLKITEQGSSLGANNKQLSQFYIHYRDYENDESRLGIANQDVASNPYLRYSASALDNEMSDQITLGIDHNLELRSGEVISTHVYYDDGEASYYQTAAVNGTSGSAAVNILSNFERNSTGSVSVSKRSLVKSYSSGGITVAVKETYGDHDLTLGFGYHSESVEDTSFFDTYTLDNTLTLQQNASEINQAQTDMEMDARSIYLSDTWRYGGWQVDGAIKYENLTRELKFVNDNSLSSESSHTFGKLAVSYSFTPGLSVFANAHQGLLPSINWLTPSLAQTSQIVRAGVNYNFERGGISVSGFNNEFNNVFSRCVTFATCQTTRDERHDITVNGLEVTAFYTAMLGQLRMPISFSYTHRGHEYADELDVTNIDQPPSVGDELAFLPENQAFIEVGLQGNAWQVALRTSYRSEQRKTPGVNNIAQADLIEDVTLVDLSANYDIDRKQKLYATINNVTDQPYVESAFNGSNLVGRGRSVVIGYQFKF